MEQVKAHDLSRSRMHAMIRGGENPEPLPGKRCARIFSRQLKGQADADARRLFPIQFPNPTGGLHLVSQGIDAAGGNGDAAILRALARANDELIFAPQNVLHAKLERFGNTQAASIEEIDQQSRREIRPVGYREAEGTHLFAGR